MPEGYPVRAIVGLGNPGPTHALQRHNIGFWWADALAASQGVAFRPEPKFHGELAKLRIAGQELLVLKPGTYMNHSGQAVQALMSFFKLMPAELLVVHDELDLPPGTARLKRGGGHAGHNGLRDVSEKIGEDYCRLRLGIGHPGVKDKVIGYALSRPTAGQKILLDDAVQRSLEVLPLLLSEGWDKATQKLHSQETRDERRET